MYPYFAMSPLRSPGGQSHRRQLNVATTLAKAVIPPARLMRQMLAARCELTRRAEWFLSRDSPQASVLQAGRPLSDAVIATRAIAEFW